MCPWDAWQPATMKFCEELLCGPIRQPANTFSNIAFIICGFLILLKEKKSWSVYSLIGVAGLSIGVTSGLYHASMSFFWQFFDVSSMFMFILIPLNFNLMRMKIISVKSFIYSYVLMLIASMLMMFFIQGKSGEWIFAVQVAIVLFSEFYLVAQKRTYSYSYYLKALGAFVLAFIVWTGDIKGWWCSPHNHVIQGHAVWHILNAISMWFIYRFFSQFRSQLITSN